MEFVTFLTAEDSSLKKFTFADENATIFGNRSNESIPVVDETSNAIITVFIVLFLVVGATGNILTLITIFKNRNLQVPSNYFIVSLCFSDLTSALLCSPLWLYRRTWGFSEWKWGIETCQLYWIVDFITNISTSLHILSFSIVRFIAVKRPFIASSINKKIVLCLIITLWIFSFLSTLPLFWLIEVDWNRETNPIGKEWPSCSIEIKLDASCCASQYNLYMVIISTVFFFLPEMLVIILSICIAKEMLGRRKWIWGFNNSNKIDKDRRNSDGESKSNTTRNIKISKSKVKFPNIQDCWKIIVKEHSSIIALENLSITIIEGNERNRNFEDHSLHNDSLTELVQKDVDSFTKENNDDPNFKSKNHTSRFTKILDTSKNLDEHGLSHFVKTCKRYHEKNNKPNVLNIHHIHDSAQEFGKHLFSQDFDGKILIPSQCNHQTHHDQTGRDLICSECNDTITLSCFGVEKFHLIENEDENQKNGIFQDAMFYTKESNVEEGAKEVCEISLKSASKKENYDSDIKMKKTDKTLHKKITHESYENFRNVDSEDYQKIRRLSEKNKTAVKRRASLKREGENQYPYIPKPLVEAQCSDYIKSSLKEKSSDNDSQQLNERKQTNPFNTLKEVKPTLPKPRDSMQENKQFLRNVLPDLIITPSRVITDDTLQKSIDTNNCQEEDKIINESIEKPTNIQRHGRSKEAQLNKMKDKASDPNCSNQNQSFGKRQLNCNSTYLYSESSNLENPNEINMVKTKLPLEMAASTNKSKQIKQATKQGSFKTCDNNQPLKFSYSIAKNRQSNAYQIYSSNCNEAFVGDENGKTTLSTSGPVSIRSKNTVQGMSSSIESRRKTSTTSFYQRTISLYKRRRRAIISPDQLETITPPLQRRGSVASITLERQIQQEKSTYRQLILVNISFLLGYVPITTYLLWTSSVSANKVIDYWFGVAAYFCLRLSECLNPVIYNLASSNIGNATRKLLRTGCRSRESLRSNVLDRAS